ncbi:DUF5134 domain-containing protein [Streptomyces coeruleoprunus]|uniref:DUF5134 domain-containing protein n=1 Tax=Streptomyces coeruleoprunus TaxID=285563 RepID=A0ABV9XIV6_9ACTN
MRGPVTSGWLLVALCAVTAAYCLVRMRRCTGAERQEAGGEAVMGLGMAVMGVPATVLSPPDGLWAAYAVVFGAAGARALWGLSGFRAARCAGRGTHHGHHLVGSLAMVYMAVPMAGAAGTGHAGHSGGGLPLVTGALLVYYGVHVLRAGARLVPVAAVAPASGTVAVTGPDRGDGRELVAACRLVMAVAMLAMLLTM